MDLWGGKFPRGIEHHPEDPCQVHSKHESSRSFNQIQSEAKTISDEAALLAEPYCPWHCFDPLFVVHVQVNDIAGMGLGNHGADCPAWDNDEIQTVTGIDETEGLQVPYKSSTFDCRHLDPAHWALDC